MPHYVVAGLSLDSDLVFPGLIPAEPPADPPDLTVRVGDVPDRLADGAQCGPRLWMDADRVLLDIADVVRMLMIGGHTLRYRPAPGVSAADVAIYLNASGLGVLLHQRGQVALHASAVRVGDAAVLFCGRSGAGKSTMAALLNDAGYPLIADDLSTLHVAPDGRLRVWSDGRRLKLWDSAIDGLAIDARRGGQVRGDMAKFYVKPGVQAQEALPVVALYRLAADPALAAPEIAPLALPNAAQIVMNNGYRPRMVRLLGQQQLYLEATARITEQGGVFDLRRRLAFDQVDAVRTTLEAHWRGLGLIP